MAFNLSKFGAGLGAAAKPLDPAADIARLLNQHTHHWMSLGECKAPGGCAPAGPPLPPPATALARRRCPAAAPNRRRRPPTPHAEKEIKEVKAKQEGAQAAYAAALEAREAARSALVDAERGLAEAEAAGTHARAELDSSKVRA